MEIKKTAKLLDEKVFWELIDQSLKNTDNEEDQEQFLIQALGKMTAEEIIGFRLRTDQLLYNTYNSEMWCAGYIMNGGCSDDGFEYFRNWVISRGKDTYYKAKENPDSLIDEVTEGQDYFDFESFWYVALDAFNKKFDEELYEYISDEFKLNEANYPPIEFNWEEENPETMKAICPMLFDKLWDY